MPSPPTRVLVEHENPRLRAQQAAALESAGFRVRTCAGPASMPGGACPLVTQAYCREALAADVVVDGLPLGHLQVYVAHRVSLPDRPVLLGLSPAEQERYPILGALATCVPRTIAGDELVEAVRDAADADAQK